MTADFFRGSFQVSPGRIAALKDYELTELMAQLLLAEAYRCGSPASETRVNAETKAADDGCDGWSGRPETPDEWLGAEDTCWQFKAGSAGTPARLVGEITKPIPAVTLCAGGRVVVVTSGSTAGRKGEEDRRETLVREAAEGGLPADKIEVIGSDFYQSPDLANWRLGPGEKVAIQTNELREAQSAR